MSIMVLRFILFKVAKNRFSQPEGYSRVILLLVYLLCLLSLLLKGLLRMCNRKQILMSNLIQQERIQAKKTIATGLDTIQKRNGPQRNTAKTMTHSL
jgi:hypothetical protein